MQTASSVDQGSTSNTVDQGSTSNTVDQGSTSNTVDQGSTSSTSNTVDQGSTSNTVDQGSTSNTVDQGSTSNTGQHQQHSRPGQHQQHSRPGQHQQHSVKSTRILSLQPDTWVPPRADIFARYNFTPSDGDTSLLTSFSVCYRIRLSLFRPSYNTHISTALSPSLTNQFVFGMAAKYSLYYNNNYQPVSENIKIPFTLHRWTHYCHVISANMYTLYIDGEEAARGPLVGDTDMRFNGTLILGQEQDAYSGGFDAKQSFCGNIAQMNIYDWSLPVEVVRRIHRCYEDPLGQIFSLDRDDMEIFGGNLSEGDFSELCKPGENVVILPKMLTFNQSISFCEQFGASLYLPETLNRTVHLYETSKDFFDSCNPGDYSYLWLAATDEESEGQWRHVISGDDILEDHFETGQPNGGLNENCVTLSKITGRWVDFPCTVDKRHCFSCKFLDNRPLYLRGLCELTKQRTAGVLLGYTNGFPYFQGFYQHIIFYSETTGWTLFDSVSNKTKATLAQKTKIVFPIGRHKWRLEVETCDIASKEVVELSVSPCGENEYMCANGYCIARENRCDLKDDCPDRSDEGGCSQVLLSPGYRKHQPPPPAMKDNPLLVQASVDIKRFSTVSDVDRFVALEMQIELMWVDSRVEFLNSRWNQEANIMSAEEAKTIWQPNLRFLNVQDGDIQLQDEETMARRGDEPLPQDFNNVETDFVFSGDSSFLLRRIYYNGGFACSFQVFAYPFDIQSCTIIFKLKGMNRELVAFDEDVSSIVYSGDPLLSAYMVTEAFVNIPPGKNTSNSILEVHFVLERRFWLLVLTMLVPTLMLVTIGYSTLYVSVSLLQVGKDKSSLNLTASGKKFGSSSQLQVRLIVSLTTLLVLYTLYNQTAATLPSTAYVKMIDVWFFTCIFLLFSIIIFHVVVEYIHDSNKTQSITTSTISVPRIKVNTLSGVSSPERKKAPLLNKIIRKWVVPAVFVLFMLVFWSVMVTSW
ncbi:Neuronal pentraxin-1-like 1 [Homarus americanus]|uniref:Neuronal pentraxin-1-like 1 n=1 Tax=Homarus americanus TaxID=6706 RepID=A0A8J5JW76_HOMAM|nr:Neuronal pentraxin-1-like 1 [Homarus americanus]